MLRIYLLGNFRAENGSGPIAEEAWSRRKAKNLLKLLALRPAHQLHKEQALELLWPDLDPVAALNNFYRTLHLVRHTLEPQLDRPADSRLLTLRDDVVRLAADSSIWVDVEEFEALIA